nr:hypothetical protein [Tanacetum cinerariifolium]
MSNPEDITDPTTTMNMALALMAKAFKLNYSTPTNNNQRISLNPRNRQIAQPGMNMGQDRQMQMVGVNGGNQFRQYAGQNAGNPAGYNDVIGNQVIQNAVQNPRVQNVGNQNGLIGVQGNENQNGNLVAARAEGNAAGKNGNQIRRYNCRGVGHYARNCTVRPRRRDCLSSDTIIDCSEERGMNPSPSKRYTELLEPIHESHQVPQHDNDVISEDTSVEQDGLTRFFTIGIKSQELMMSRITRLFLCRFYEEIDDGVIWVFRSDLSRQSNNSRWAKPILHNKTVFIKTDRGLRVKQKDDGIFISQDKSMIGSLMYLTTSRPEIMFTVCAYARFQVTPKVSHLYGVKRIFRYLKGQPKLGLLYPRDSPFDLEAFFDSDYAGATLDRISTIGGCQFLRKRLISWQCKKETIVANSTTKVEYVAAASCCGEVLWIQNQMLDYRFNLINTKIYIDNESTLIIKVQYV